jgi:hypothetical protein
VESGTNRVIGVVYGTLDVGTIEQFSRIDPISGKLEPEIQRVTSFALAHHTDVLRVVTNRLTDGRPLADYVCSIAPAA